MTEIEIPQWLTAQGYGGTSLLTDDVETWKLFAADVLEMFIKKWKEGTKKTRAIAANFLKSVYAESLFDLVGAIEQDVALAALGIEQ